MLEEKSGRGSFPFEAIALQSMNGSEGRIFKVIRTAGQSRSAK
jgi:hypothetical protein